MAKEVFVIGIGGTGMRCLESFVHLCAMGMFDDHIVNILALDTDRLNGNFTRLKELIEPYQRLNGGKLKSDTFFSARIDYKQFSPNYDGSNVTFNSISDYSSASSTMHGNEVKYKESDIVDLFLNPDVREMQLEHGYRAQTQLGSMLMYHAIIEEAYKTKQRTEYRSELREFIKKLNDEKDQQVFIFGSVFGGTGASSIPIIPRAFQKAAEIMFGEHAEILNNNNYASVVMTNYFSFGIQHQDTIVATSDKFALNSQAALMFYASDKSVKNTYKRLYLLGREKMRPLPTGTNTDTGGKNQRNPVDYLELLSAFAAYDFFKVCDRPDAFKQQEGENSQFYFRSLDADADKLDFECFTDVHEVFKRKFGLLLATTLLDATSSFFAQKRNEEFKFPEGELTPLYNYMKLFYDLTGSRDGWALQMYQSAEDEYQKGMLFHSSPFNTSIELKKLKFNETLYDGDTPPAFKQKGGILGMGGSIFNTVKDSFKDVYPDQKSTLEDLIKRTYATFLSLYFNETIK